MMLRFPPRILALLWLMPLTAQAQVGDRSSAGAGFPFYLQHYPAHSYKAHPQNWVSVQDVNGIIYAGNYDGVLTFDGVNWELITTPTNTTVRSMDVGMGNTVFVGLQGDLGYLRPDSVGRQTFTSLLPEMPENQRDFWDVWSTHAMDSHVYFHTKRRLYRWDGADFRVWRSKTGFHTSFRVGDDLYVREKGVGLLRMQNDRLSLIPHGEIFADLQVFVVDELSNGKLLIGTQKDGLHIHDGSFLTRFPTEADAYLSKHRLYHGNTLPGGYVALGMLDGGGLILLNERGDVVNHLTEGDGLPDGWINHLHDDAQGGLWLSLNSRGLVHLQPTSEISKFTSVNGLEGTISDIERFGELLYVATSTGLFVLDRPENLFEPMDFEQVHGVSVAKGLLNVGDVLLVAGHGGLYMIRGEDAEKIADGTFLSAEASQRFPGRYYLGSTEGVALLRRADNSWELEEDFVFLGEEVFALSEDLDGALWITTRSGKVYRKALLKLNSPVEEFVADSRDERRLITLARVDDEVLLLGATGLYTPEENAEERHLRFVRFGFAGSVGAASDTLLAFSSSAYGKMVRVYSGRVEIVTNTKDGFATEVPLSLTYPEWTAPARAFVDSDGVAWISSGSMLVRYDASVEGASSYEAKFPALLRRVTAIDSNRLLFGGTSLKGGGEQSEKVIPDLLFHENALRFEFALPSYNDVTGNEYQYWLEGKDEEWSNWTRETSKNYTNLFEGTYRFHLRGRNAQGYISPESVYTFTVLPPWYRSMWAYGVYGLALFGLALFARQHRRMIVENRRAKAQAEELAREREVNERLSDLNRRLEQANETLRQADRLKDEFLANTSHELRTPLTGILGCSSILRDEVDDDHREFVEMIEQNGERLLKTLDSLLDLARLRAGLMEFDFRMLDVGERSRRIAASYEPVARTKGIVVDVSTSGDVSGMFDEHCLDCILNNLIGNAVKFTKDGGVDVTVTGDDAHVAIAVQDTGIGIEEEFMPFLFDEFKQESTGLMRSHEGNGLGLAVTSRIVDMMNGSIDVRSEKGVGSTFTVRLPLDPDHAASSSNGDGFTAVAALET